MTESGLRARTHRNVNRPLLESTIRGRRRVPRWHGVETQPSFDCHAGESSSAVLIAETTRSELTSYCVDEVVGTIPNPNDLRLHPVTTSTIIGLTLRWSINPQPSLRPTVVPAFGRGQLVSSLFLRRFCCRTRWNVSRDSEPFGPVEPFCWRVGVGYVQGRSRSSNRRSDWNAPRQETSRVICRSI